MITTKDWININIFDEIFLGKGLSEDLIDLIPDHFFTEIGGRNAFKNKSYPFFIQRNKNVKLYYFNSKDSDLYNEFFFSLLELDLENIIENALFSRFITNGIVTILK